MTLTTDDRDAVAKAVEKARYHKLDCGVYQRAEPADIADAVLRVLAKRGLLAGAQGRTYPHMCRMDHPEIGHKDSDHERCPLCRANDAADAVMDHYQDIAGTYFDEMEKLSEALSVTWPKDDKGTPIVGVEPLLAAIADLGAEVERLTRERDKWIATAKACAQAHDDEVAEHAPLCARIDTLVDRCTRLREALTSIANNSCCGSCQEAALVARAALGAADAPKPGEDKA